MRQDTIDRIRKFSEDRDWDQFHSPANLAKSIAIEACELLECFQWSDTDYDIGHVSEELADVLVYCRDLLDKLGLDEDEIVNRKMEQNERKYPVEKAKGSAAIALPPQRALNASTSMGRTRLPPASRL